MPPPRRPVALAIRNPDLQADRIFHLPEDGFIDQTPYTPWRVVRELARAEGFDLVTADRLTSQGVAPRDALLVAYDWPPQAQALVAAGARPAVLTSLEPPVIAWELYYHLPKLSARFPSTYLFAGAAERIGPGGRFRPLLYPQVRHRRPVAWQDWPQRRFLVSIVSNKAIVRSFTRWFDRPREVSLKRTLASRRYPPLASDLYRERLAAIEHFAHAPDFDVFGQGWQRRHPAVPPGLHHTVLRAYRGPAYGKLWTLARYRYALCLENSCFPGYISEKIFDCFFAGTIPVYLGAPDVEHYIPTDAFIDLRQFEDYAELEAFLRSLDAASSRRYLEAAAAFLSSAAYRRFRVEHFARDIVDMLHAAEGQAHLPRRQAQQGAA